MNIVMVQCDGFYGMNMKLIGSDDAKHIEERLTRDFGKPKVEQAGSPRILRWSAMNANILLFTDLSPIDHDQFGWDTGAWLDGEVIIDKVLK